MDDDRVKTTEPVPAHWDEVDFTTATDVVPVRVPLERVEIGRWKYVGTDLNDLELLYELESSSLRINCSVRGLNGATPPATFRVCDISAADLSLATVIPGSLESMVARLVLESEEPIECSISTTGGREEGNAAKPSHPDSRTASGTRREDHSETHKEERAQEKRVHSHIVVMTASVHETGHLRDILLFLKGGYSGKVLPDALFLSPRSAASRDETDTLSTGNSTNDQSESSGITLLESLPVWARYIPWWAYSRNVRIFIQNILIMYSLFTVIWAFWQLYRNVDIIQHVLEPIIAVLREVYLASVIEVFDWLLAVFTECWMRFLSPLNVIQALLLPPTLQAVLQLKTIFLPLAQAVYYIFLSVWQCLPNTQLLATIKSIIVAGYGIVTVLWHSIWMLLTHLLKPVHFLWQGFLNSRIAVGSLDLNRLKLSWVVNLFMGSFRSIGKGVAKLCGYTSRRRKLLRVKQHPLQYISPPRRHSNAHPKTPVLYSSPLTKQD